MENPTLTFVTPSLLSGDKSNADVVAHEIAHSWTGNLVTNHNWEHFWLNEGFTVFLERKIVQMVYGKQQANLSMLLGLNHLKKDIEKISDSAHTCLKVNLHGVDPDDVFSSVPYEKGFNFLFYLETLIGEENFGALLHKWLSTYAKRTATSEMWKDMFNDFARDKVDSQVLQSVDWDSWLFGPGMPPVENKFDNSLYLQCQQLVQKWLAGTVNGVDGTEGWSPSQFGLFLDTLNEESVNRDVVTKLDHAFNFSTSRNLELRFRFFLLAIKSEHDEIIPLVQQFVSSIGRMKYVRPIYNHLKNNPKYREVAINTFLKHKSFYHNICSSMVSKDLGISS
eukprot:TRINITY_DN1126_c0_g1_i7.p1 TRINITY_DN1126_c0_g1~~TRINITY_DN1126_c0_g1_i7.p1  ORF type:complete len:337 (-),score=63.19 TRINITY_DN1126_c0_g1_i7:212-1222(-)